MVIDLMKSALEVSIGGSVWEVDGFLLGVGNTLHALVGEPGGLIDRGSRGLVEVLKFFLAKLDLFFLLYVEQWERGMFLLLFFGIVEDWTLVG